MSFKRWNGTRCSVICVLVGPRSWWIVNNKSCFLHICLTQECDSLVRNRIKAEGSACAKIEVGQLLWTVRGDHLCGGNSWHSVTTWMVHDGPELCIRLVTLFAVSIGSTHLRNTNMNAHPFACRSLPTSAQQQPLNLFFFLVVLPWRKH